MRSLVSLNIRYLEDIYQQELLARLFHSLTRIQKDPSFHLTMGHLSL